MKKIVVKVGTNVLTNKANNLDKKILKSIASQVSALKKDNYSIILVSSGAVQAGRSVLKLKRRTNSLLDRQVFSSVGQVKLLELYTKLFAKENILTAQLLATKEDFRDRYHYFNMKNCIEGLLHEDVIVIANENDVIAIDELMFTDNDELASLIASMIDADRLILLTNVDGLYDSFPIDDNSNIIKEVKCGETERTISEHKSLFGRGGMHTKFRCAKKLATLGIKTHIVNGKKDNIILDVINGKKIGTTFLPLKKISSLKKRIAQSFDREKGTIILNPCLIKVLLQERAAVSILPIGIEKILGKFEKGDLIRLVSKAKKEIGFGIAKYSSNKLKQYLGRQNQPLFIHYDYLYIGG